MKFPPPINYQANYENNVWNSFNALGLGYSAYLYHANRTEVWLRRPSGTDFGEFFVDEDVLNFLIGKGLAERKEDQLIPNSTFRYELTEQGKALYDELVQMENYRSEFVERVKPII